MDSKRALEDSGGDLASAEAALAQKGLAAAAKRSGREANQGVIEPYIHGGGRIGAIIELNCETDFVAKNNEFIKFVEEVSNLALSNSGKMEDLLNSRMKNSNKVKDNLVSLISKIGEKI